MIVIPHRDLSVENLDSLALQDPSASIRSAIDFISTWLSGKQEFIQKTSGSTGPPKEIVISREQMLISARETLEFLQIGPGGNALVCLSTDHIAGKMMIVRAIENMMDIILEEPNADPLYNIPAELEITLGAMVPIQVSTTVEEHGFKRLEQVSNLLIGGSGISESLEKSLSHLKGAIYHTYGMTETVSHIALRPLNKHGVSEFYTVLPGVLIRVGKMGTLEIKAAVTDHEWIRTQDMVEIINERTFRYLGRADNVINTGGIKVFPEKVESEVMGILSDMDIRNDFFIAGLPDQRFGQAVTLFFEGQPELADMEILNAIKSSIEDYTAPRQIMCLPTFLRTANGKIKRKEILARISFPSGE